MGSVSLEITTRELQLEQELPWMSQDFWAWSSINCHVLLFITICGKILSFNEKKKKNKKKLINFAFQIVSYPNKLKGLVSASLGANLIPHVLWGSYELNGKIAGKIFIKRVNI